MTSRFLSSLQTIRRQVWRLLSGPRILAFAPAAGLLAFWAGGEAGLLACAVVLPALALALKGQQATGAPPRACDAITGLTLRDSLEEALDHALAIQQATPRRTLCLMIQIDEFEAFADRYGLAAADDVLHRTARRLKSVLRDGDSVCKMGRAVYGIGTAPVPHLDLEAAIQMATRLQAAVEEPITLDATKIYVSCSIGFCLGLRSPQPNGASIILAAQTALGEAIRHAPSAIRSFSPDMQRTRNPHPVMAEELAEAMELGQVTAWFQPQVSTDTGMVSGFEALVRWSHPMRGMISPAEFLPAAEESGQMERLGDLMLLQALKALRRWDEAGVNVPQVGVNFSPHELRNPRLVDKVKWQLDRFGIAPKRLTVEVLETVVAASPDDVVTRNINGLAQMGCAIDLDDFGTGHASISSIRRFSVERLKIDRSFVMKVDRDIEQQRMVSAILTMAERLGLSTLAEGVETAGEHAMLAQLGCDHVQGYEIARPMPVEQTIEWIRAYHAGLVEPPRIGRRKG